MTAALSRPAPTNPDLVQEAQLLRGSSDAETPAVSATGRGLDLAHQVAAQHQPGHIVDHATLANIQGQLAGPRDLIPVDETSGSPQTTQEEPRLARTHREDLVRQGETRSRGTVPSRQRSRGTARSRDNSDQAALERSAEPFSGRDWSKEQAGLSGHVDETAVVALESDRHRPGWAVAVLDHQ